eukprot:399256-Rhodomonas_salina.4
MVARMLCKEGQGNLGCHMSGARYLGWFIRGARYLMLYEWGKVPSRMPSAKGKVPRMLYTRDKVPGMLYTRETVPRCFVQGARYLGCLERGRALSTISIGTMESVVGMTYST